MMPAFIPFASDDEISRIDRELRERTLPKVEWTHAAHFAAALWQLKDWAKESVAREFPAIIRAYNETTGVANTDTSGYHETITHASIRAADHFLSHYYPYGMPRRPLFAACNALMETPLGKSDWLLAYWSRTRLFSVEARRVWVEPDLRVFPF